MLSGKLTYSPGEFVDFPAHDIGNCADDIRPQCRVASLWKAARMISDRNAKNAANARISPQQALLAQSIRGIDISDYAFSRQHVRYRTALGVPGVFSETSPASKIRDLAREAHQVEFIAKFLEAGAKVKVLTQVSDTLDSVSSGIARYIAFCDLLGAEYFPPASYRLRKWSAFPAPVKHLAYTYHMGDRRVEF